MVLVTPQPKAERRCKTLNIRDIRCFVRLSGCANHSFSTNPSGEQSRTGWIGWHNSRSHCIYCADIMQLTCFSFSPLCEEIINKNIDKAGVLQQIYRIARLKCWWSNRWSESSYRTISTRIAFRCYVSIVYPLRYMSELLHRVINLKTKDFGNEK